MSKLTDQQRDFIKLVQRSIKGDGWAPVSETLGRFMDLLPSNLLDLRNLKKVEDVALLMMAKLSPNIFKEKMP